MSTSRKVDISDATAQHQVECKEELAEIQQISAESYEYLHNYTKIPPYFGISTLCVVFLFPQ